MLKTKLYAIGGAILAALLVAIKFLIGSRARAVKKADRLEGALERHDDIQEGEAEIDQSFSRRAKESNKDIEDGKVPDHLSKPR